MDKKLLSIGETAKLLGISIDTLRRWEKGNILQSFRPSPASKRYYRKEDIDYFLSKDARPYKDDLINPAIDWVTNKKPFTPPSSLYCETADIFYARLQRLEMDMTQNSGLKGIFSLAIAITGEIGNNSYNHNIGNWPDIPGAFVGYNIRRRLIVLADRGQGVYTTLKRVIPGLKNDEEALKIAFTKYISARAPEDRGNGLKFVKDVVLANPIHLKFYTGDVELELKQNAKDLKIKKSGLSFHGCMAIINF